MYLFTNLRKLRYSGVIVLSICKRGDNNFTQNVGAFLQNLISMAGMMLKIVNRLAGWLVG
jgi:hypothetical protein